MSRSARSSDGISTMCVPGDGDARPTAPMTLHTRPAVHSRIAPPHWSCMAFTVPYACSAAKCMPFLSTPLRTRQEMTTASSRRIASMTTACVGGCVMSATGGFDCAIARRALSSSGTPSSFRALMQTPSADSFGASPSARVASTSSSEGLSPLPEVAADVLLVSSSVASVAASAARIFDKSASFRFFFRRFLPPRDAPPAALPAAPASASSTRTSRSLPSANLAKSSRRSVRASSVSRLSTRWTRKPASNNAFVAAWRACAKCCGSVNRSTLLKATTTGFLRCSAERTTSTVCPCTPSSSATISST
mmetsp:Transcript_10955/g.33893  ORF Transcript_10955/g.33893 Transcript_10955/m.33893 type:complete len:306 (-) Transcript_10955:859-1776(-)